MNIEIDDTQLSRLKSVITNSMERNHDTSALILASAFYTGYP